LQPTTFCNIDCTYCYLDRRNERTTMTAAVVEAIGSRILASPLAAEQITVVWHGGEPTTLGPDWYEDAFARLAAQAPATKVTHAFQTNGVAVDDRWITLWRDRDVRVGLSLDGPRRLNDLARRTRGGRSSFDAALRGLRRLRDAGLPFHVITVLSRESLEVPDELFDFLVAEGVTDVCFNVEEIEGANGRSSLSAEGSVEAYGRFLRRFAERMRRAGGRLRCREVDGVAGLIAGDRASRLRNPQTRPLEIVSVSVEGGLSTYSPELLGATAPTFDDFVFGDVRREGPEAILRSPAFLRLRRDVEDGVAACAAQCAYFGVCGGGAPGNKFFEHGHCRGAETLFCRFTRKAALDALLPLFETEAGLA
jgi:uncharacterized protein